MTDALVARVVTNIPPAGRRLDGGVMGRLFLPFDIAGGSVLANRREPSATRSPPPSM
jgi:hypothetical protein